MIFTNAQDVINSLYTLPKLHEKADLSYIKKVLSVLDNPQNNVKTIHVTGTNGKGSTSYYLSSLLQKAGQKTGLFVSPYVFEFNERIQFNGQNISNQDLVDCANQVEKALQVIRQADSTFSLVTFEYEVALAFVFFAQMKCDYAIIEVGIGGEHDKTNVIMPEVSVITTVGLDHEQIIGPSIQDIAREKSGVIKWQRPVVLGNVPEKVLSILMAKAQSEDAVVKLLGRDFKVDFAEKMTFSDSKRTLKFAICPQVEGYDIAVSIQIFDLLGIALSDAEIQEAINNVIIPGRYQILQDKPLVVLDGAHNIQAMKSLLDYIHNQQLLRQGKVRILIMMMRDKDINPIFSLFKPSDQVELTTIDYPRAAKKADFPSWIKKKYHYNENWREAFIRLQQVSESNDILLVTGSFYLIGEILQMEGKNENRRNQ